MSAVIFAGPSLPSEVHSNNPGLIFLPPVKQGDIYTVMADNPQIIGIIDGFFDGVPAVLHKEILWALNSGIQVYGAASMGALRAAELHTFGMIGVGRIFEAYRDGEITADDEVALQHGPPETGYLLLSEPLVNIRATLQRAVEASILDQAQSDNVLDVARKQFYQQRTWSRLLNAMAGRIDEPVCKNLATWLEEGKCDQKRLDAELLLKKVGNALEHGGTSSSPPFSFEWTEAWEAVVQRQQSAHETGLTETEEAILNELRLSLSDFKRVRKQALASLLAEEAIQQNEIHIERNRLRQAETDIRLSGGMYNRTELEKWARKNDVTARSFDRMVKGRACIDRIADERVSQLCRRMIDQLRQDGEYRKLSKRARKKASKPLADAVTELSKLPRSMLLAWYFEDQLGTDVPRDLHARVLALGLESEEQFLEVLVKEYAWQNRKSHHGAKGKT